MKRLAAAIKIDFITQWRNKLYGLGIGVGILLAVMMAWLAPNMLMPQIVPAMMLAVLGGSTMLYVAGMITFERDEQTLSAVIVSPLRATEYLWAKIATLGFLATLEAVVMVFGCLLIQSRFQEVFVPHLFPVLLGIVLMGMMYILVGIILVVRFRAINEFLMPMAGVAVVLQFPMFYFAEMLPHSLMLVIPTSAPALLVRGGYLGLTGWQWIYALGYSTVVVGVLVFWAHLAFQRYVVRKAG